MNPRIVRICPQKSQTAMNKLLDNNPYTPSSLNSPHHAFFTARTKGPGGSTYVTDAK
jgi:hypothetical protein